MAQQRFPSPVTLKELASIVGGEVRGDPEISVIGISEVRHAKEGDLVFVWVRRDVQEAFRGRGEAVVVPPKFVRPEKPCLVVSDPRLALATLLDHFFPPRPFPSYISPKATVEDGVKVGGGVFIGDYTFIGRGSVIGSGTVIFPHAYIGRDVRIGRDCRLYPFVTLYEGVTLGDRVVVHAGAVIGKDGFGFVWDGQRHRRIPQLGTVVIEDDVEIGANTCIDRATLGETRIKRGTKVDNLVQIAHNCLIGSHCVFAGQVGLAGSVRVGDKVMVGGQVGVADHVEVGAGAMVAGKAGIMDDIPPKTRWGGFIARPHLEWLRVEAALSRLPEALKMLQELMRRVEALEKEKGSFEGGGESR